MANVSKINGYDIKDSEARNEISTLQTDLNDIKGEDVYKSIFPTLNVYGNSPKLVKYSSTNNKIQILQKTNSNYLLYELDNANGDSSDNSVGEHWDLIRLKKIQSCLHAYVCKNTYTDSEGTITTLFAGDTSGINSLETLLFANGFSKSVSGVIYGGTPLACYGLAQDSSLTYTINTKLNNKINILFYVTPSSSGTTNIYVNDKLVETLDLSTFATANNCLYLHEIKVPYRNTHKTYTVKIENTDSKLAYVSCLNYVPLAKYDGEDYDSFKCVLANEYYINSGGASDYAIHDYDLNKYCGSFHGGEIALSQRITMPYPRTNTYSLVDWKENFCIQNISSLNDGEFYITPYLTIEQLTNINNKGKMLSNFIFDTDSALDMSFNYFDGNINSDMFYTALTCNSKLLDTIKNPGNYILESGNNYLAKNNGLVECASSTSKLKLDILYSKFGNLYQDTNNKNGRVENVQYYNKFYYGIIDNLGNPTTIDNLQFRKILISKIR